MEGEDFYRVHKTPYLHHMNPVHILIPYFIKVDFNIIFWAKKDA
jgi:hypothetical protein